MDGDMLAELKHPPELTLTFQAMLTGCCRVRPCRCYHLLFKLTVYCKTIKSKLLCGTPNLSYR